MKKWLYALMSLLLTIGALSLYPAQVHASEGYFTDGYHGYTSGNEVTYMKGDEFSLYYTGQTGRPTTTLYRLNDEGQIIQFDDQNYYSKNDPGHPTDTFKLYAIPLGNTDPNPNSDPYVIIRYVEDLSLLPDDYYHVAFSATSTDPNLPSVPGYTKGDIIHVRVSSLYVDEINQPWTVTDYPKSFLKQTNATDFEAINYGDGTVTIHIAGQYISEEISIAEIIYKSNIRFIYNEKPNGDYSVMPVNDCDYPTTGNTFGIGKQYKLTIAIVPTINGVGVGDEVDDPENIEWSVDNDNVTLDNINKTITFNKVGESLLTAKYNEFTVSTHLFIREDGIYVKAIDPNITVEPNTAFSPAFSLSAILDGNETNHYAARYILTPDMQEKYGVKYLQSIKGITFNNMGEMSFSEDFEGETITYQYVVLDTTAKIHTESCVSKMNELSQQAQYDYDSGKISRNDWLQIRFGLVNEICECAFNPAEQIEMTITQDDQTYQAKTIDGSITITGNQNETVIPDNIESVLKDLVTENNSESILAQKEVLDQTYQQVGEKKLDLSYEALLHLDKCLQIIHKDTLKTNVTGISAAEGLVIAKSDLNFNDQNILTLVVTPQTDQEEMASINEYVLHHQQKTIAIFDFSLTHQTNDQEPVNITQTAHPVRITMPIPADVTEPDHLVVIRNHEGTITELPVTIVDGQMMFETDRFSTYALVEKKASNNDQNPDGDHSQSNDQNQTDSETENTVIDSDNKTDQDTNASSGTTPETPKTADTFTIIPYLLVGLVSLSLVTSLSIRRYRHH